MDEGLQARLDAAWEEALGDLEDEGRLEPGAVWARPSLPGDFDAFLARALHEPEARDGERETLVAYHTRTLQRMRADVVASRDEPQRTLMHTPLELARMPRLQRALEGLFALAARAGVAAEDAYGAASPEALVAARPTFAALFAGAYYGSYGPPLYTSALDLAALARELTEDAPLAVIDRRLVAPLVHELSHGPRARLPLSPPYLDECVAAWLGARAYPPIAIPEPGDDTALYLAAWFTQVGWHLARLVGEDALVRAHLGVARWDEVLPAGLAEAYASMGWEQWRAGRQLHFLGVTAWPDPWIRAAWLAAEGRLDGARTLEDVMARPWPGPAAGAPTAADEALVAHARAALATAPRQTPEHAWRVVSEPTPTRVERATGRLVRDGIARPLEVAPLHFVLPPSVV